MRSVNYICEDKLTNSYVCPVKTRVLPVKIYNTIFSLRKIYMCCRKLFWKSIL